MLAFIYGAQTFAQIPPHILMDNIFARLLSNVAQLISMPVRLSQRVRTKESIQTASTTSRSKRLFLRVVYFTVALD